MIVDILSSRNVNQLTSNLLTFLIVTIINMFVLRWLWNNSLVKHVTVLKPLGTLMDALFLSLSLTLLR
jgi:hypothetical protein